MGREWSSRPGPSVYPGPSAPPGSAAPAIREVAAIEARGYPGPVADLANTFSWSRSRNNMFQECRRRYYYHYYGAWGGWDASAPLEVRRLYVLKQLASRQQWAGRVVHDAIEMALHAFAQGRDIPVEPFIADVIDRMRGDWRSSKAGHYHDTPKSTALFEH